MSSNQTSTFRESLFNPDEFTLTFELVPNRGGKGKGQNRILELAKEAAADGRLRAVSITENAGGNPTLAPDVLGNEIRKTGLDVINHFSCKDKNRNQIESLLFAWDRQGLSNLLILTGEYPKQGYYGQPKPVFDLGAVQALDLIKRMNTGSTETGHGNKDKQFQPTSFLKGVVVSPFKILESELLFQYIKLRRKINAGADFVITQLGYDARKFHELLLYMKIHNLSVPVLGNVFIPNLPAAKMMYEGELPGCKIHDRLYQQIKTEADSADRGKKARLTRAAKLLAVLKGMGYSGAHIGGPGLAFSDLAFVMDQASLFEADWREFIPELSFWPANGYFIYQKDPNTGLNSAEATPLRGSIFHKKSLHYALSKKSHDLMFNPEGSLYGPLKKICFALERKGFDAKLDLFEFAIKMLLYKCQNCGDCRLADLAFLCPHSGCAKFLLNGPCGGSQDGWCEVYPKKKRCFYVRIFERLKFQELEKLFTGEVLPPREWSRNHTSAWLHFFHDMEN
jgi:methylenetetrahydrofolate reductase (NADPH)